MKDVKEIDKRRRYNIELAEWTSFYIFIQSGSVE